MSHIDVGVDGRIGLKHLKEIRMVPGLKWSG